MIHRDRVYAVVLNHRFVASNIEAITLQIQKTFDINTLNNVVFDSFVDSIELVLTNRFHYLSKNCIIDQLIKICTLDYDFEENEIKYSRIKRRDMTFNYLTFLMRRVIDLKAKKIISLCQTSSFRVELELKYFTRAHFLINFDQFSTKRRSFSVSLICFIDGFDLYRNRQRSLMRMYMIIAVFTFRERTRRANVHSLTLKSHDSNFANVIETLQHLEDFDEDISITINDEEIFLCVFTHMFVSDMSQQQKNSKFKSQNANLDCRFCFISSTNRDQLEYDLVANDRFHN